MNLQMITLTKICRFIIKLNILEVLALARTNENYHCHHANLTAHTNPWCKYITSTKEIENDRDPRVKSLGGVRYAISSSLRNPSGRTKSAKKHQIYAYKLTKKSNNTFYFIWFELFTFSQRLKNNIPDDPIPTKTIQGMLFYLSVTGFGTLFIESTIIADCI